MLGDTSFSGPAYAEPCSASYFGSAVRSSQGDGSYFTDRQAPDGTGTLARTFSLLSPGVPHVGAVLRCDGCNFRSLIAATGQRITVRMPKSQQKCETRASGM